VGELRRENSYLAKTVENYDKLNYFNDDSEMIDNLLFSKRGNMFVVAVKFTYDFGNTVSFTVSAYDFLELTKGSRIYSSQLSADIIRADGERYATSASFNLETKSEYTNQGYATAVLESAVRLASRMKLEKLTGYLSPFDERDDINKNRRNHLYEKFGFEFHDRSIVLNLS
jgi:GNAT superfamily N-acetyltransferase